MNETQKILDKLIVNEKRAELIINQREKLTGSKIFKKLYSEWKNLDRENLINRMFDELKENIDNFWTNEKYNKMLSLEFNMIYLEHSGLYGGGLEAFGINFQEKDNIYDDFKVNTDKWEYLDNISSLPTYIISPLYELTAKIQGEENNFDGEDDLMNIYDLYESTASLLTYKVFQKVDSKTLFNKLKIQRPFFFCMGEHDFGKPKLVYKIE